MERRSLLLIDATVPLIVGGVIVVAGALREGAGLRPLALLVAVAAALVLVARRRAPGWTLLASGALVQLLFVVAPDVAQIAVIAPAVALYSLALNRGRLQQLLAAIAAIAAVVIAEAVHAGGVGIVKTLGHVALVAVPLLAAEALRTRRAYVSLLLEQLALAETSRQQEAEHQVEQERLRIARDVHDIVAHTLTTINVQAATAVELFDRDHAYARASLESIEDASRTAIAELRGSVRLLRDRDSGDASRLPAPGVENVPDLVERARNGGLDVRLEVSGVRPEGMSDAVSLAAYRIVQESLTNARRHAAGAAVRVNVAFERMELAVIIANAVGTTQGTDARDGVGITGMSERATALGGSLRAVSRASEFCVSARLPYAAVGT